MQTFQKSSILVDTGRKLNLHKTFRRRLERLLNVLCTFNLRPVPTRMTKTTMYSLVSFFRLYLGNLPWKNWEDMIMQVDFLNCTCSDWETIVQTFLRWNCPLAYLWSIRASLEILNWSSSAKERYTPTKV